MIRQIILAILVLTAFQAKAYQVPQDVSVAQHLQAIAGEDEFTRLESNFAFCTQKLNNATSADPAVREKYKTAIKELAEAWKIKQELPYSVLDQCQNTWKVNYYQPLKVKEATSAIELNHLNEILASQDLVNYPYYLQQRIRIFIETRPDQSANVPLAPFEILSGMKASERELNTAIEYENRRLATGTAVGVALTVTMAWEVIQLAKGVSMVGRAWWPALIGTAAILGIEQLANWNMWLDKQHELQMQVRGLMDKFNTKEIPDQMLLEQFEQAVQNLAYFYSIDVYQMDGKMHDDTKVMPADNRCINEINRYMSDVACPIGFKYKLASKYECADPAAVWLAASDFIINHRASFAARAKSQKLKEHAIDLAQIYKRNTDAQARWKACSDKAAAYGVYEGFDCDFTTSTPIGVEQLLQCRAAAMNMGIFINSGAQFAEYTCDLKTGKLKISI